MKTILILDSLTGEVLRKLESHRSIRSIVGFLANGEHLATTGGNDSDVTIWNTSTGESIQTFDNRARIVVLSQDRMSLALADPSGLVRVCNPWDGSEKYSIDLRRGEGKIEWIDFGRTKSNVPCLFSVISVSDGIKTPSRSPPEIVIQDPQTGQVIARASLASKWAYSHAALDPTGKCLIIVQGHRLYFWDWEMPSKLRGGDELRPAFSCYAIAWVPDGQSFAVATSNTVELYHPKTRTRIGHILLPRYGNTRLCYVSGTTFAFLDSRSLKMLRLDSTISQATFLQERVMETIHHLNPGPNGQLELSRKLSENELIVTGHNKTIRRHRIPRSFCSRWEAVFSADQKYAFVDGSGLINIYDNDMDVCTHKLRGCNQDSESSNIILDFSQL